MATFLLLWNPAKLPWPAYDDGTFTAQVRADGAYEKPWSTGNRTRGIAPGDQVFLVRTGSGPRGIVAGGVARSAIYLAPHWDTTRDDRTSNVDVMWTTAGPLDVPLSSDEIRAAAPSYPAHVQSGGVELDEAASAAVDGLWTEFLGRRLPGGERAGSGNEVTLRGRRVTTTAVLDVLAEYDDLGQEVFLDKYGYGVSRRYWVRHDGDLYESKALLGVAAGLPASTFSGGHATSSPLRRLGFEVVDVDPAGRVLGPAGRPRFRERDAEIDVAAPAAPRPDPDPDDFGRGLRAHRTLENWLAQRAAAAGRVPADPAVGDPKFDVAWTSRSGSLTVVEVKSLARGNETSQLRLGLGQILDYREQLGRHGGVRGVLFVERAPSGEHWTDLCARVGVDLCWPDHLPPDLFD